MNLETNYMGLQLKNPIIASASPISENADNIKRLADAGASAVVMFSIFEEQLRMEVAALDHYTSAGNDIYAESTSFFPNVPNFHVSSDRYLDIIRTASETAGIPVIGSLNGISDEGWVDYAGKIEEAGASGLELNIYTIPSDTHVTGEQIENSYVDVVKAVKETINIPVAVKMNPYFSSIANMCKRLEDAGADALVLFNRFIQPDFDLDELEVVPHLQLSTASEIKLPLRWIAIMHGKLGISLAATSGVHSSDEVVKYLLAGADAVMSTSAILKKGIPFVTELIEGLEKWMDKNEYESVDEMKGAMSQQSVADPTSFERANYIKTLEHFKRHHASDMPW